MKVEQARALSRGVDTVVPLDTHKCHWLIRNNFDFVVRYLHGRYAITREELRTILCSGLAVMLVTPSRAPGWIPTEEIGFEDAATALDALTTLGVPTGMTTWLDIEGCASSPIDWVDAWSHGMRSEAYQAGAYVGRGSLMTSEQLWKRPYLTRYWRSGSKVPEPSVRGWCMQQLRPLDVQLGPLHVDVNVIEPDFRGGLPRWIVQ